jgi:hypothetical protein
MMDYPVTLEDWQDYVDNLPPDELLSQAIGANSLAFVDSLRDEGYSNQDILAVFLIFARAFDDFDAAPPAFAEGQYVSYSGLLEAAKGQNKFE